MFLKIRARHKGFTLIEILLAVFIFAIILGMISSAVYVLVQARDRTVKTSTLLAEVQYAMLVMEKDCFQIVDRPIINELGQEEPAFYANDNDSLKLQFTRAGVVNPQSILNRSGLLRVAYLVMDNKLIRRIWFTVDRTTGTSSEDEVLLEGVKQFSLRVLDNDNNFLVPNGSEFKTTPKAVEIDMTINGLGNISRIFVLSEIIESTETQGTQGTQGSQGTQEATPAETQGSEGSQGSDESQGTEDTQEN